MGLAVVLQSMGVMVAASGDLRKQWRPLTRKVWTAGCSRSCFGLCCDGGGMGWDGWMCEIDR
jgi:hypothetical protein